MTETIDQIIERLYRLLQAPWFSLVVTAALLACIWLIVLPTVAQRPWMRQRIDWLEEEGIDPNAMYYTDLEVMEALLVRQRRLSTLPSSSQSPNSALCNESSAN